VVTISFWRIGLFDGINNTKITWFAWKSIATPFIYCYIKMMKLWNLNVRISFQFSRVETMQTLLWWVSKFALTRENSWVAGILWQNRYHEKCYVGRWVSKRQVPFWSRAFFSCPTHDDIHVTQCMANDKEGVKMFILQE